jgi:hypothetical protein
MNALLRKSSGGDLRSNDRANEVAEEVIQGPQLLGQLLEVLSEPDDVIPARTAHALERVPRNNQRLFRGLVPQLISLSASDRIPTVKWHLAMMLRNTASVAFPFSGHPSRLERLRKVRLTKKGNLVACRITKELER